MPKPPEIVSDDNGHDFDRDDISPKEFLISIMRDKKLPITVRMEAASKVAVYEHPRLAQVNQETNAGVTIRIEGGLPPLPGTNVIMPSGDKIKDEPDEPTG